MLSSPTSGLQEGKEFEEQPLGRTATVPAEPGELTHQPEPFRKEKPVRAVPGNVAPLGLQPCRANGGPREDAGDAAPHASPRAPRALRERSRGVQSTHPSYSGQRGENQGAPAPKPPWGASVALLEMTLL